MVNEKRWDYSDLSAPLIDEMVNEGLSDNGMTKLPDGDEVADVTIAAVKRVLSEEPMLVATGPLGVSCVFLFIGIAIGREQERRGWDSVEVAKRHGYYQDSDLQERGNGGD